MGEKIVDEWYGSIYDVADTVKKQGLVLCGDGIWGKYAVKILTLFDVTPECICYFDDEEKNCDYSLNIPHLTISEAFEKYSSSIYIQSADSNSERDRWNRLLKKHGMLSKESGLLFWRYTFLLDTGLDIEEYTYEFKNRIKSSDCENLMFFNHMLHSGSNYFQELIDGDKNILTIPTLSSTFMKIYDNRFKKLNGKKLWIEICAQMAKYFDTTVDRKDEFPESTTLNSQHNYIGADGEFDWNIMISPNKFYYFLKLELRDEKEYLFGEILKGIFSAYANSLGKRNPDAKKYWIAYDIHDPQVKLSAYDKYELERNFNRIVSFFLVREPLQHLNSIMKAYVTGASDDKKRFMLNQHRVAKYIETECGVYLHVDKEREAYVVRFEDLKHDYRRVMSAIYKIIGLQMPEEIDATTINGRQMFFRKKVGDTYEFVTGHDSSAVDTTEFLTVFSDYDLHRLKFLFKDFIEEYYQDYHTNIESFTREEMNLPYGFIDLIIEEVIRIGDVGGEAESFRAHTFKIINQQLDGIYNKGKFYPLLEYNKG